MFDFSIVTQWVDTLLRSWMSPTAAVIVECVLVGVCLLLGYAVIALALIYIERKVCAFFQCRLGPNRVGPYGVIQSVADMFKMLIKEIDLQNYLFNTDVYELPPKERLRITDSLRREMIEIFSGTNIYDE